jgi:hypothetical protein
MVSKEKTFGLAVDHSNFERIGRAVHGTQAATAAIRRIELQESAQPFNFLWTHKGIVLGRRATKKGSEYIREHGT